MVEVATPNGTNNPTGGTKKNELRVIGEVEPLCRSDERRNSFDSGRTQCNYCEVFRVHALGVRA